MVNWQSSWGNIYINNRVNIYYKNSVYLSLNIIGLLYWHDKHLHICIAKLSAA